MPDKDVKPPPSAYADDLNQRVDMQEDRLKSESEDIRRLSLNMRMTTPTRMIQVEQVANNALFCQQSEPPMTNNNTAEVLGARGAAPAVWLRKLHVQAARHLGSSDTGGGS